MVLASALSAFSLNPSTTRLVEGKDRLCPFGDRIPLQVREPPGLTPSPAESTTLALLYRALLPCALPTAEDRIPC